MADYVENKFDWSPRHTRLRAELVLLSVVIFAILEFELDPKVSTVLPFDSTSIPPFIVVSGIGLWWIVTAVHFSVRTLTEWDSCMAAFAELKHLDRNSWMEIQRVFDSITARLNLVQQFYSADDESLRTLAQGLLNEGLVERQVLMQLALRYGTPDETTEAERRTQTQLAIDQAKLSAFREAETRMSQFVTQGEAIKSEIARCMPQIDERIKSCVDSMEGLLRRVHKSKAAHRVDRLWIGVIFPAFIALVLVLPTGIQLGRAFLETVRFLWMRFFG